MAGDAAVCRARGRSSGAVRNRLPGPLVGLGPFGSAVDHLDEVSFGTVLRRAGTHSGYLLLTAGFFVCGFHVAFIATHLPSFLVDQGVAQMIGATALSLIGLFNMLRSFLFGRLGDRFRKKRLLSLLYNR